MTDLRASAAKPPWFLRHPLSPEDRRRLVDLPSRLRARIIGQDDAIEAASQPILRFAAGLNDPDRPVASCLFAGPTGTGKTELVRVLAKELYGSADALLRLDMSEYHDKHSVSRLFGSPPGYIGYDDGGQITNFLEKTPYGIILCDEIEKADPSVFDPFLQMLDAGRLTDGQGQTHRCTGSIIVLTTNAGAAGISSLIDDPEAMARSIQVALRKTFRPEFLNRLDAMITFRPLSPEALAHVVQLQLAPLVQRARKQGITLEVSPEALTALQQEGYDPANGARPLRRLIERSITDLLADALVRGTYRAGETLTADHDGTSFVLRPAHAPIGPAHQTTPGAGLPSEPVRADPSGAATDWQHLRTLVRPGRLLRSSTDHTEQTRRIRDMLQPREDRSGHQGDRFASVLRRRPERAPPEE